MPIYEFYCPENNTVYQFLARSLAYRDKVPSCPDNPAYLLQKQISRFAILGKAKEDLEGDPFAGLDEAKMEALMADVEGEMGAMSEDNPDPKQLGHLMRKMTDLMGDKTPPELREMVKRLEAGEDPEKLEAEFGGLDEGGDGDLFATVKKMVHGNRPPIRNPKLYEMSAWVKESSAAAL
ncbi:MAG: cytochrome C [Verrucomicrobiota bacterium]